jgi:hypothetical protein
MDTNRFLAKARPAGRPAKLNRARANACKAELQAFLSGGIMVVTGLMLAVIYCMLKHQVQV